FLFYFEYKLRPLIDFGCSYHRMLEGGLPVHMPGHAVVEYTDFIAARGQEKDILTLAIGNRARHMAGGTLCRDRKPTKCRVYVVADPLIIFIPHAPGQRTRLLEADRYLEPP